MPTFSYIFVSNWRMTKYSFQLLSSLLSAMFVVSSGFGSARIQTALPRSWSVIYFICKTLNLRPSPVCELLTFYNGPGTGPSDLQYRTGKEIKKIDRYFLIRSKMVCYRYCSSSYGTFPFWRFSWQILVKFPCKIVLSAFHPQISIFRIRGQ